MCTLHFKRIIYDSWGMIPRPSPFVKLEVPAHYMRTIGGGRDTPELRTAITMLHLLSYLCYCPEIIAVNLPFVPGSWRNPTHKWEGIHGVQNHNSSDSSRFGPLDLHNHWCNEHSSHMSRRWWSCNNEHACI